MSRKGAKTYNEQWQANANEFLAVTGKHLATAREIAAWAIETGKFKPSPMLLLNKAAEDCARAMRDEYAIDPQGRRVRVKHAARIGEGEGQLSLWADHRDPAVPRSHVELAFQQRRQQIVGDCHQLKMDTDSYNQYYNKGRQIRMVFDFTLDLEELDASSEAA